MKESVSIIIPAYNEEENIKAAITSVTKAVEATASDYEIIVIDDGSKDSTYKIVEKLKKNKPEIKLAQNKQNRGFGYSFKKGIRLATSEYIAGFPGDNDMSWRSLRDLIKKAKDYDLVTSYMKNPKARSFWRRTLSKVFVYTMNFLFLLKLKYYNGHFVCKRQLLENLSLRSDGITLLAEVKVRLLKKGVSFAQIPFEHTKRIHGTSKTFSAKSLRQVFTSTLLLLRDVYLEKGKSRSTKQREVKSPKLKIKSCPRPRGIGEG